MKKILLTFLIFTIALVSTGCGTKAFILMKSEPLTTKNARQYEQYFSVGQRIYYAVVAPKGFKDSAIKIEIVKVSDKVPTMGYSIQYAQDLAIDTTKKYYTNYFTLSTGGAYVMQVFELRRPDKCIARYDFRVK
ncbi:MAG: hypothetical protein K6C94_00135 [Candidatus Gastranaerophilales bacterium]|nr:hypothetical protein [Candidatus Gastranaerophilales bacterium]